MPRHKNWDEFYDNPYDDPNAGKGRPKLESKVEMTRVAADGTTEFRCRKCLSFFPHSEFVAKRLGKRKTYCKLCEAERTRRREKPKSDESAEMDSYVDKLIQSDCPGGFERFDAAIWADVKPYAHTLQIHPNYQKNIAFNRRRIVTDMYHGNVRRLKRYKWCLLQTMATGKMHHTMAMWLALRIHVYPDDFYRKLAYEIVRLNLVESALYRQHLDEVGHYIDNVKEIVHNKFPFFHNAQYALRQLYEKLNLEYVSPRDWKAFFALQALCAEGYHDSFYGVVSSVFDMYQFDKVDHPKSTAIKKMAAAIPKAALDCLVEHSNEVEVFRRSSACQATPGRKSKHAIYIYADIETLAAMKELEIYVTQKQASARMYALALREPLISTGELVFPDSDEESVALFNREQEAEREGRYDDRGEEAEEDSDNGTDEETGAVEAFPRGFSDPDRPGSNRLGIRDGGESEEDEVEENGSFEEDDGPGPTLQ